MMSLTKRQIKILMILKNQSTWITSEKLSEILNTNKKTIQNDVSLLVEILGSNIDLISNRRNGYWLKNLNKKYSEKLAEYISKSEISSSLNIRTATISTYLCFQTDFVSMQSLAEIFYLSKTSVSESIKTIQRWIDRKKDMKLLISKQYGVKVQGTETNILIFLSLTANKETIYNAKLPINVYSNFLNYYNIVFTELLNILKQNRFLIAGDVFESFVRLIALIILRDQQGFEIESSRGNSKSSTIIESLVERLEEKLQIIFTSEQVKLINERFLEYAPLITNQGVNSKYAANVQKFEKETIEFLNLPINSLFEKNSPIYFHIDRMMNRIKLGHAVMNHYARKSISAFPLETYLIKKFIPINFGVQPSLSETGYLVDYLADALDEFKNNIRICLVSDRAFASIRNLKRELNNTLNNKISKFDVFPRYIFDSTELDMSQYDIFLTTEEAVVFFKEDFLFIDNTKKTREYLDSIDNLKEHVQRNLIKKRNSILSQYFKPENKLKIRKNIKSFDPLIPKERGIGFSTGGETYLHLVISEDVKTNIIKYTLTNPLMIKQRKIKTIYVVSYNKNDNYSELFSFFDALSTIFI